MDTADPQGRFWKGLNYDAGSTNATSLDISDRGYYEQSVLALPSEDAFNDFTTIERDQKHLVSWRTKGVQENGPHVNTLKASATLPEEWLYDMVIGDSVQLILTLGFKTSVPYSDSPNFNLTFDVGELIDDATNRLHSWVRPDSLSAQLIVYFNGTLKKSIGKPVITVSIGFDLARGIDEYKATIAMSVHVVLLALGITVRHVPFSPFSPGFEVVPAGWDFDLDE